MKILALDLGTTTGWAVREGGRLLAGSKLLLDRKGVTLQAKRRGDRRLDRRMPALYVFIEALEEDYGPFDWLVFEDVQFGSTTMQAHLWASFRTVVWIYAWYCKKNTECLATGKLKVFAAGHGAATKNMMAAWLAKKCPKDFKLSDKAIVGVDKNEKIDDNGVDAAHLLLWAESTLRS
jgi:hypothetical protein